MARQFVVFALVLFAVIGFACAATPAESPKASADNADVGAQLAPGAENEIGNTEGADAPAGSEDVVEAPIGGPDAAAAGFVPAESPKSGASAVKFSATVAGAAVAGFFFF
ncbi:outer membrane protein H.8-like [Benincasa hispida]|uniref:outer membrane protein H.8-like n=1 Tax=Benincasa hispida TaxID=102211 RepID=UPI00190056F9|nr:outer membrane protein H.8-like [Benincasa hispida]